MRLSSTHAAVAAAVLVAGGAGIHLLSSHDATVTPSVWPLPATSPSSTSPAALVPDGGRAAPSPSSAAPAAVPVLPDVLRRLNADTGATAAGMYQLLQQLERALGRDVEGLVRQLEPGR